MYRRGIGNQEGFASEKVLLMYILHCFKMNIF